MDFKVVYLYEVENEMKKGEQVFCLDRYERTVFVLNDSSVKDFMEIINHCQSGQMSRYEFWVEKEKVRE